VVYFFNVKYLYLYIYFRFEFKSMI